MLILFDIDDTLLDHRAAERAAATVLHGMVGATLPLEAFLSEWSRALEHHFARYVAGELSYEEQRRARLREVVDPTLSDADADRLLAQYLEAYEAGWSLFADVLPCLERLGARGRGGESGRGDGDLLGIVSNGPSGHQRRKLAQLGLLDRFDPVVISGDGGAAKPDPAIFLKACALAGVSPSEALHIGDRYDLDAEGARAAGLRGVWLDRHGRAATQTHEPPVIASLDELPSLLAEHAATIGR